MEKDAQSKRESSRKTREAKILEGASSRESSFNENPLFILNVEVFFLDLPQPFPIKSVESAFG